jgi:hypothetical protein
MAMDDPNPKGALFPRCVADVKLCKATIFSSMNILVITVLHRTSWAGVYARSLFPGFHPGCETAYAALGKSGFGAERSVAFWAFRGSHHVS